MRRSLSMIAVGLTAVMATACAGGAPNPLACAAAGAALAGGGGVIAGVKSDRNNDGDSAAIGGTIGAVVGGGLGYVICAALQEEPAPPPPPPKAAPAPPVKEKIVLRGVNFDFDKANIRKDAQVILDEAASILQRNADVMVSVEGHTDAVGTDAYNQKLSDRRATSVKSYLSGKGVSASRLTTRGLGESKPVSSNQTKDGRAMNRRVELLVK